MKNDVVRRLTKLDNNDAKTMQSIWLFISKTLPEEEPEESLEDKRSRSRQLAHSFLGAFAASRTERDWKEVKEEYLTEKYAD